MSAAPGQPLLIRSLGNQPPPAELAGDLRLVAGFSPAAQGGLWSVLGPCLTDPIPAHMNETLDAFAEAHGIPGDGLARAVRGCRALVRGAALLDLDGAALAEDARRLAGGESSLGELLLRGYGAAKAQIREVASRAALGEHGRVLEGVDWRVDQVMASSAGGRLRFPVVVMTLRCHDKGVEERVTVQATPEKIAELRAICDEILGGRGG
jgi:COMM domain